MFFKIHEKTSPLFFLTKVHHLKASLFPSNMMGAYLCEFTQRIYLTYIYALINFICHILYSGIFEGTFFITNNLSEMLDE